MKTVHPTGIWVFYQEAGMLQIPPMLIVFLAVLSIFHVIWWMLGDPEDFWELIRPYDFTTKQRCRASPLPLT